MILPPQTLKTDFKLKVVQAGCVKDVIFGDLLARPTVVSLYMRNNTPSCDRQVESLEACYEEVNALGYDLIALSRDSSGSQSKYAVKKKLRLRLASDSGDLFAQAADCLVEKSMYGRTFIGPLRSAFVVDKEARVLAVIDKVDPKIHGEQILAVLRELSMGAGSDKKGRSEED